MEKMFYGSCYGLERPRKTTKTSDQYLKSGCPKYKAGMLTTRPQGSVLLFIITFPFSLDTIHSAVETPMLNNQRTN
jgi:hypothetical protein